MPPPWTRASLPRRRRLSVLDRPLRDPQNMGRGTRLEPGGGASGDDARRGKEESRRRRCTMLAQSGVNQHAQAA